VSGTLARAALERGDKVWAVTRGQRPLPAGVTGLIADRKDPAGFAQAIRSASASWELVVDCIAFNPGDVQQDLAALPGRAGHLVMVSTDFVFDPAYRRFPQPEDSAHFLKDGYGGLKRQAELTLQESAPAGLAWTILRPCHIYGPGSQLGCLPEHARDPQLIRRLQNGETLRLVGSGHFLQQPILASDLAKTILSCTGNPTMVGQTFNTAGPDIVESREYYRLIAEILGVKLSIEEVPVNEYHSAHPEASSFLCHRIYDLTRLRNSGAAVHDTPLIEGLRTQVQSLLAAQAV
jgi:nucleoside-diphosphate-sugar epimerase